MSQFLKFKPIFLSNVVLKNDTCIEMSNNNVATLKKNLRNLKVKFIESFTCLFFQSRIFYKRSGNVRFEGLYLGYH